MELTSRPWEPQDLIDDLQELIDEEPDTYLNFRRTTMCTARDYLKEYFSHNGCSWCKEFKGIPLKGFTTHGVQSTTVNYCPRCGKKLT